MPVGEALLSQGQHLNCINGVLNGLMPPAQVPSVRCQIHASQILRSLVIQQRGSKGCPPVAGCSASLSSSVLSLNLGPRSQGPQLYQEGPEVRDSPGESLRFRTPSPSLFPFMVSEPQGSLGSLLLVQHWLGVGHLGTQGPQLTNIPCPGAHSQRRVFRTL